MVTLIVVGMLLIGAEGATRLRQWVKYGFFNGLGELFTYDRSLKVRTLVPGSRTATIHVNAAGFRGPPISPEKPPRGVRIAYLGGSTTFCAEVSDDRAAWPHQVGIFLKRTFPNLAYDYVNGGVPGYRVADSQINFEQRINILQPDITVIYHAANDIKADLRPIARAEGLFDGRWGRTWLERRFSLWALLKKNWRLYRAVADVKSGVRRLRRIPPGVADGFKRRMKQLIRAVRAGGGRAAVATFSHRVRETQSEEARWEAARSAIYYSPFLTPEQFLDLYQRYNRAVREAAAEEGALLIGGEGEIPGDGIHFHDAIHFRDAGSRAMASRVGRALAADSDFRALAASRGGDQTLKSFPPGTDP